MDQETSSVGKDAAEAAAAKFKADFELLRSEIGKFIVGQREVVESALVAIVCGGHLLLEGVPGLGKTALVTTIAKCLDLAFKRIQFTPDLLPADILGTNILVERGGEKVFSFQRGPVFTNILLADEINRATPKTQSALLETMQERTVTVANATYRLDAPYFVLATQNPLEMDGTYPLPEAQLDRFFFKLNVRMPGASEFSEILDRTTGLSEPQVSKVGSGAGILEMGRLARRVPIAESVKELLIKIVTATHPENEAASAKVRKFVRYGASPRAAQAMLLAARVFALLDGRFHVAKEDVAKAAAPALRHRLILSFEGEASGVSSDEIVAEILASLD